MPVRSSGNASPLRQVQLCLSKEKDYFARTRKMPLSPFALGLEKADRGKLIMACGTGKTFTGLKIAEDLAGLGRARAFPCAVAGSYVPDSPRVDSRQWTPLRSFAVCSDTQVGKRRVTPMTWPRLIFSTWPFRPRPTPRSWPQGQAPDRTR